MTVAGWLGDHCPTNEDAFLAYTKSLCAPDIYNMVRKLEPISDIVQHKFPSSLRRHYEKLKRFPENFLVLGDAVCSFNPTFGQGMTSAAMQAQALDACLGESRELTGLYRAFFRKAAQVVDIPWQLATGEDFRYPEVEGPRPPEIKFVNRYVTAVHRAVQRDTVVYKAFIDVMNLTRPPQSLMRPAILFRVLSDVLLHQRRKPAPGPVAEAYEQLVVE